MKPYPRSPLKNLTVPVIAIGKLLPVVAPPSAPTARRLGWTFTDGKNFGHSGLGHTAASRRRWNVKAPREVTIQPGAQKRPDGRVLVFTREPIDSDAAVPRDCKGAPERRQQLRKLAGEPPGRIDDEEARSAQPPGRLDRWTDELGAQDPGHRAAAQRSCQEIETGAILDRIPQQEDPGRPFAMRRHQRLGEAGEFVPVLVGRIDQDDAAPLL